MSFRFLKSLFLVHDHLRLPHCVFWPWSSKESRIALDPCERQSAGNSERYQKSWLVRGTIPGGACHSKQGKALHAPWHVSTVSFKGPEMIPSHSHCSLIAHAIDFWFLPHISHRCFRPSNVNWICPHSLRKIMNPQFEKGSINEHSNNFEASSNS